MDDIKNINNDSENYVYKALSLAFAKNSLPYSLLENEFFKNSIDTLRKCPNIEINKKKLKDSVLFEGNKINEEILSELEMNKQTVTIALDGWTNVRGNKVTNLLLISNNILYYYSSIENKEAHNNAEYLVAKLEEKINYLLLKNINVIAIATDNEIS